MTDETPKDMQLTNSKVRTKYAYNLRPNKARCLEINCVVRGGRTSLPYLMKQQHAEMVAANPDIPIKLDKVEAATVNTARWVEDNFKNNRFSRCKRKPLASKGWRFPNVPTPPEVTEEITRGKRLKPNLTVKVSRGGLKVDSYCHERRNVN